jgi:hypothetical protein
VKLGEALDDEPSRAAAIGEAAGAAYFAKTGQWFR